MTKHFILPKMQNPCKNRGLHILAEKEGFEPSMGVKAHTPLAGEPLRPLGHLSGFVDLDGQASIKLRSLADCTHFGKP